MAQLFKLRGDAKSKPTENYEGEPKGFCRNSIFVPYLDYLISQLESRFHQINLSARREELPSTPHKTIKKVDKNTFPLIYKILKLLMLIAAAATIERAHSSLKFLKNDLRFIMSEDRMNAFTLLYIHKDLSLNYDQIIDDSARRNPRKMLLVNPVE